ncbi:hypothetical protein ONZ45_g13332 [Pleurotus djamor]|nr:hypothetical protein ONZ45_g13332 [Pleurotus djamor]
MSESPIPRVKFSPTPHHNDRYTALPRNRRYSQSSAPEPRPTLRTRRRSSSVTTTRQHLPSTTLSTTPHLTPSPHEASYSNRNSVHDPQIPPRSQTRHYLKPDPNIIFSELNQQLGYFGNTPLRDGLIRDFLDVDDIFALHDRDIMDSREREDLRGGRVPMTNRGLLPVFGTPLRQVSMYASAYAPVNPVSPTCAFEVPLVVLTCITELRRRSVSSPLPFLQSNAVSRRRLLHLSQAFDSPPYIAQTLASESTVDVCALLKTYALALPEPVFSDAVSEGLWRWCIRPSLEEKDVATLESMDVNDLSDAEITRAHIAALLFRLLPSANLGLLVYVFNFLSSLRRKANAQRSEDVGNDENHHATLASYTEIGRIFGEAIFGRITNQKSIMKKNQVVHGNARAVSMMVWVLRRWNEIERGITGAPPSSVQTPHEAWFPEGLTRVQNLDGSSGTLVNGARDGRGKAKPPTSSWLQGAGMVLQASVPLQRDENKSESSTQARKQLILMDAVNGLLTLTFLPIATKQIVDERLADTSENLLAPVDVPNEVEVRLPNPYGGVEMENGYFREGLPSQGPDPSASPSTPVHRKPDHSGSELIGALKRIGDLEVELESRRLAEASARERENLTELRAVKAEEELLEMKEKVVALEEDKRALEKQSQDTESKVLGLEERLAGCEYALMNVQRDKEAAGAQRDAAHKLLEDIRQLLSVTTGPSTSSAPVAEPNPVHPEGLL